jgi:hypothetical protein
MESFDLEYRLACPPRIVFAELADPSYIARIAPFDVTVTHVRDGQGHRKASVDPPHSAVVRPGVRGGYPRLRARSAHGIHDGERHAVRLPPRPLSHRARRRRYALHVPSRVFHAIPGLARLIKWPLGPINRRGFDNLARQLEERFRASR